MEEKNIERERANHTRGALMGSEVSGSRDIAISGLSLLHAELL